MKKCFIVIFGIIALCGCNNPENTLTKTLENNGYSKKKYSNFMTYQKDNILITLFDKDSSALITYEDQDEITITVNVDNKNIYSTYNCKYDFSKKEIDNNCKDKLNEIKQAKKEIESELKALNLSFEDFQN